MGGGPPPSPASKRKRTANPKHHDPRPQHNYFEQTAGPPRLPPRPRIRPPAWPLRGAPRRASLPGHPRRGPLLPPPQSAMESAGRDGEEAALSASLPRSAVTLGSDPTGLESEEFPAPRSPRAPRETQQLGPDFPARPPPPKAEGPWARPQVSAATTVPTRAAPLPSAPLPAPQGLGPSAPHPFLRPLGPSNNAGTPDPMHVSG